MANYVAPTGYVDLDNDCEFALDRKSTRSREKVNPTEDLAFYFNTYLVPKYGLANINVNNTASYLKELDMNWTKMSPELKDKVLDIMVDNIFKTGDYDFKNRLLSKLNVNAIDVKSNVNVSQSNFTSGTGTTGMASRGNLTGIILGVIVLIVILFLLNCINIKPGTFPKFT